MPHNPEDIGEDADRVPGPRGEIYIEYKQVGQAMKVTAVDAVTFLACMDSAAAG